MSAKHPGKSVRTTCESCGKANYSHGNTCTPCRLAAEDAKAKETLCLLCGKPIRRSYLRSFYCLPDCAKAVGKMRSVCLGKVHKAVRSGELAKLDGSIPCVDCGAPADRYDHRDYSKPLDVVPVCRGCNKRRGAAKLVARAPERREVAA